MSVTKKFTLHSVSIGASAINQLKLIGINPNVQKMMEYGSGLVDPTFSAIDGAEPILRFQTTAIKKVLSAVNLNSGTAVTSSAKANFYFQQMADGATRLGGSTALRVTSSKGIAVINMIRASNGPAIADVTVFALSIDGETDPLEYTTGVAVPTLAATDQMYTVGPAMLAGSFIGGIESMQYDPRITVRRNRADGEPYPVFGYILRRGDEQDGPTITLQTRHLDTIAAGTTVAVSGTTYAALRAYKAGSTRETLAALKHVLLTPNSGTVIVQDATAEDGGEGMATIDINAVATSSLPAVSATTDVAIPTS